MIAYPNYLLLFLECRFRGLQYYGTFEFFIINTLLFQGIYCWVLYGLRKLRQMPEEQVDWWVQEYSFKAGQGGACL